MTKIGKKQFDQINKNYFEYQSAIKFLVDSCLADDGKQKNLRTSKPLVMHSIRVGLRLIDERAEKSIVIAAILHDLIEDTAVTPEEIKIRFGSEVATIVEELTYDTEINDEIEKGHKIKQKVLTFGPEVLKLKVIDSIDNMNNYLFTSADEKRKEKVFVRWGQFIQTVKDKVDIDLSEELQTAYMNAKTREGISNS